MLVLLRLYQLRLGCHGKYAYDTQCPHMHLSCVLKTHVPGNYHGCTSIHKRVSVVFQHPNCVYNSLEQYHSFT